MLSRSEQAKKRWGGSHQAVDHWLSERAELLVKYCTLAGLPPYERSARQLPEVDEIRDFCGVLVDYVSTGHFEVYDQIVRESSRKGRELDELAEELFPLISDTTEIALDFNDRYGALENTDNCSQFDRDLSALGEAIELRLEFEDRLLGQLEENELLLA
ncbi:sigma D regulator [Idiomarina tyrosinivorans]|uniref:Sigma D regulator n=1 Tax=Idiomarina tyrosinivorans TaxID=1445662 RepID=A0A432ZF95_9GAMM|nr:sigma D regulator [Idiomarina tyrosinivorans]RUO76591.1 sigma D regulator [Idiomarina tyrosinivorans]